MTAGTVICLKANDEPKYIQMGLNKGAAGFPLSCFAYYIQEMLFAMKRTHEDEVRRRGAGRNHGDEGRRRCYWTSSPWR